MLAKYYLAYLTAYEPFGPVTLARLFDYFEDWQQVWEADGTDLAAAGLNRDILLKFLSWRKSFQADIFENILRQEKIELVTMDEPGYPLLLKNIKDAPPLLYYRGDLAIANQPGLAVVGSRKHSRYAKQAIDLLLPDLVRAGLIINSGLALGIDGLAHRAAIDNGGQTIAVLGTGLDQATLYPQQHLGLADNILETGGLIMTEFAPLVPGYPSNFPRRNRIVSGLSLGVLVIEAAIKSGSLTTAKLGLEQGREVMAVPGPINSKNSEGTNYLIKNGARPITEMLDVLEALKIDCPDKQEVDLTDEELAIKNCLANGPKAIDELKVLLNLDICVITTVLTMLELKNVIGNSSGMYYNK